MTDTQKLTDDHLQKKFDDFMSKNGDKAVKWKTFMNVVQDTLAKVTDVVKPRLDVLDKEVAELGARGPNLADAYKGAWLHGVYKRGMLVTQGGSLFLALKDTDSKPATSDDWKLVVKSGKDGKDLRP
jgi:hypothetical protein